MKWTHALVPACLLAFTGCEPGGEPDDDRIVAGEYEVTAPELVIHASVDGEPLGRLYRGDVMDVHEVTADGWAFGFAGGDVQACVWTRYLDTAANATIFNFEEDAEPGPHAELCVGEARGGDEPDTEAFASKVSADGDSGTPVITDCDYSHYWDNWDWEAGAGLGPATGKLDRGTEVHWRYVTIDGNGVMARIGDDDWVFIARPCIPLEP
jgi:hypothetical protein